jgi:hypothetical protein
MTLFYLALALAVVVGAGYLALVGDAFLRVRRQILADEPAGDADADYGAQARGFTWKALGGVAASTAVLALISATPSAWYLLPFLSIGSAVAVVVAFLIDRRATS